jgi:hypothetical protein
VAAKLGPCRYSQGDQIGRIFANWAIVFFGQFSLKIAGFAQLWGYYFPREKVCMY